MNDTVMERQQCSVHDVGKLVGKINWRIPKGPKDFIERSTVQRFNQVGACLFWNVKHLKIAWDTYHACNAWW